MDEQRLNEIRKRAVIVGRESWYHDDVPDLLVEIDNLCHQLRAADEARKCWMTSSQNNLDMALEIDARLQAAEAERDRLAGELREAQEHIQALIEAISVAAGSLRPAGRSLP